MSRRALARRPRQAEAASWRAPAATFTHGTAGPGALLEPDKAPAEPPIAQQDPPQLDNDDNAQPMKEPAPAPVPTKVTLTPARTIPIPPKGTRKPRASTDVAGITWSLTDGTAKVDSGTSIAVDGSITIGAGQTAGNIQVRATNADGAYKYSELTFTGIPTTISSTSPVADPPAGTYGHVFDHVFDSTTGKVADLKGVAVGEKFPKLDNPDGADHAIKAPDYPFGGTFNLHTATLTEGATNNWFLTDAGQLGGEHDSITIGQGGIHVAPFVKNASNPTPAATLPVGFAIEQHFHWYNPLEADATKRWTDFRTVKHERTLKLDSAGALVFETKANDTGDGGDAYVGAPAVSALAASPATSPKSAAAEKGKPAPAANSVTVTATTLPGTLGAKQKIAWSLQGDALGCTIKADPKNPLAALIKIGSKPGTLTVRAALGGSFDETQVTIT
jgi:hypothetical protein